MTRSPITIAVEGQTDVPVARRLIAYVGGEVGPIHVTRGKARLDGQLAGYDRAAAFAPWFVLRDLNGDAPCAGVLKQRLLPASAAGMCLRIPVRSVEAWLLADRERVAAYFAVRLSTVPADPDSLAHPKRTLVAVAAGSRVRAVREDMQPATGTTAAVGPGYSARVEEFALRLWRPDAAAESSPSLARCIAALWALVE